MGSWERLQVAKTEAQEKDRTRRENIAKYYLDLSKLTFAALVLGSVTCMITGTDVNLWAVIGGMAGGIATIVILAMIGNQIFK